ncbi:hypothetical protein KIPB_016304, partial [Kipferlia bialata]
VPDGWLIADADDYNTYAIIGTQYDYGHDCLCFSDGTCYDSATMDECDGYTAHALSDEFLSLYHVYHDSAAFVIYREAESGSTCASVSETCVEWETEQATISYYVTMRPYVFAVLSNYAAGAANGYY